MKKRTRQDLLLEEKLFLAKSLVQSNDGDEVKAQLDFECIESCLAIMKTGSLLSGSYGFRKSRTNAIENMVDLYMHKEESLGYLVGSPVEIQRDDIDHAIYDFSITYVKEKGKTQKRKHTDTRMFHSAKEEDAIIQLKAKLKSLKESLIEVVSISKKMSIVVMLNGDRHLFKNITAVN